MINIITEFNGEKMFILPDIYDYETPQKTPETVIEQPKEIDLDLSISATEMAYMTKCFNYLRKLNLIKTKYDFCAQYLSKSQHYFSMLETANRLPSISSLHHLIHNMEQKANDYEFNKPAIYHNLLKLVNEGQQHLYHRFLKVC